MKNVEKDVVKKGNNVSIKKEKININYKTSKVMDRQFSRLLVKICLDLKVENHENEIERFLENNKM